MRAGLEVSDHGVNLLMFVRCAYMAGINVALVYTRHPSLRLTLTGAEIRETRVA